MSHYSGNSEWPLREEQNLLQDLDTTGDALSIAKLQVEATMFLASAISDVAAAIQGLSNDEVGLRGSLAVAVIHADETVDNGL